MVDFVGELANKHHPTPGQFLNIYVIGAQGSGKGSFINTILTLLSDEDSVVTAGADVGGGADHQTDRLHGFNLAKMMRSTRLPRFPFRIFDTWGTSIGIGVHACQASFSIIGTFIIRNPVKVLLYHTLSQHACSVMCMPARRC
jgi:hypothetical protein